jgi:hypothetical protein
MVGIIHRKVRDAKKLLPDNRDRNSCAKCGFFLNANEFQKECVSVDAHKKYDTKNISTTTYCEYFCVNGYKCDECKDVLQHEKENIFFTQLNMEHSPTVVGTYCENCVTDYIIAACKNPKHVVKVQGVGILLKK